ncbi:MAG: multidrug transporter [Coprococcus sp.]|nr:multidrug transporter [Coprococcus sp.]
MNRFSERDWKLFRRKIVDWQEAYMDKLNKEYIEILSGEGNPSDKFWELEKRIKEDKKDCGVQCEMSRSNQFYIMMSLLDEGAITMDDLNDFSDDLKDTIRHFAKR